MKYEFYNSHPMSSDIFVLDGVAPTVTSKYAKGSADGVLVLPYDDNMYHLYDNHPSDSRVTEARDGICSTLTSKMGTGGGNVPFALDDAGIGRVRRLTPVECERLQGFPDDYTRIPYRGKTADKCPDAPRYKAIGNSWAIPCVRWIGERVNKELNNDNNRL